MSDSADSDFYGLANVVGVGDNAIGGVDLATSAQRFFPDDLLSDRRKCWWCW